MRQRSNLIIVFGIAFFLIGGAIVYLLVSDDDDDGGGGSVAGPAQVTVFVAAQDIPANTLGADVIEQGLLTTDQVAAGSQPVGAITSASALDNQIFAVGVSEGDVITSAQLAVRSLSNITVPDGYDGVALTVTYTNGGAGYIAPGDLVNVYGLFGASDGAAGLATDPNTNPGAVNGFALPRTELILTNVLVLDVSAQAGTSSQSAAAAQESGTSTSGRVTSGQPLTFLLAMTPADIERVVQTANFADLYFSLTADEAPPAGETDGSDGGSVNGPVSTASAAPQG